MMLRKKKRVLLIVTFMVLLFIIVGILILWYLKSDILKSDEMLFTKYLEQNLENIKAFYNEMEKNEYDELLEQSQYITQTKIKVNYTENIGTSLENTKNAINQLKLKINGQTDRKNQYNYQDIRLLKNDEKISQIEYIKKENTHGIRFSDLFDQYVLVDNENLKELFEKAGCTQEQLANIPDTIEFNNSIKNLLQFSEKEKQNIKTKYINIINNNISKDKYSKLTNQNIQIDGKTMEANAYVITITNEQLNDILIKILEEISKDEMILIKIDKIQNLLETYAISETMNLRGQFVGEIKKLITNITRNNIGQEEAKIIVYETKQKTIKTLIQHPDYEIYIDLLSSETENYIQVSYQNIKSKKEQIVTYKKQKEKTNIILKNVQDKTKEYSLVINKKINGNKCIKNLVAKYQEESNKVEATMEQETELVNSFTNEVILNDENAINLSKLEAESVQAILEQVNSRVSDRIEEVSTIINKEDLWKVVEVIGLVKEEQNLERREITQIERSRFNSKLEMLQGNNLKGDAILNIINAIEENLIDFEVISDTELKLKLDTLNKKEEVATNLKTFIEKNPSNTYNVKIKYDETTGLASDILLTMVKE